jgi:hypothetical protein
MPFRLPDEDQVDASFAPPASNLISVGPATVPGTFAPVLQGVPTNAALPTAGQGLVLDAAGFIPTTTLRLAVFTADPPSSAIGQIWYRSDTSQLCIRHDSSTTKRVTLT